MRVARANFFPKMFITGGVGYEAFNTKYLFFTPESLIYNVAGDLVAPLINRIAIKADYMNANAKQLQALYDYQRVILNAFTEVVNRVTKVQNYSRSIEIKKQQLESLETAVEVASKLFQNARVEYMDVLFAQRDRNDARIVLIETKSEQLSAIVNAYQALGGGWQFRPPQPVPVVEEVLTPLPEQVEPMPAAPGRGRALARPRALRAEVGSDRFATVLVSAGPPGVRHFSGLLQAIVDRGCQWVPRCSPVERPTQFGENRQPPPDQAHKSARSKSATAASTAALSRSPCASNWPAVELVTPLDPELAVGAVDWVPEVIAAAGTKLLTKFDGEPPVCVPFELERPSSLSARATAFKFAPLAEGVVGEKVGCVVLAFPAEMYV